MSCEGTSLYYLLEDECQNWIWNKAAVVNSIASESQDNETGNYYYY